MRYREGRTQKGPERGRDGERGNETGGNRARHPVDDLAVAASRIRLVPTRIADCKPFTMPCAKSSPVTLVDSRLARASSRVKRSRGEKEC